MRERKERLWRRFEEGRLRKKKGGGRFFLERKIWREDWKGAGREVF